MNDGYWNEANARIAVTTAVKEGKLDRPDTCELCGRRAKDIIAEYDSKYPEPLKNRNYPIEGHHWRGWHHPFDIWWLCHRCNVRLMGIHDGSLTREEARKLTL